MDRQVLVEVAKKGKDPQLMATAAVVAAGLAVNAQVCMRQWSPELIARKAIEIAEDIHAIMDGTLKPDPE